MGKVAIVFDSAKYSYHIFAAKYAARLMQNKGYEIVPADMGTNPAEAVKAFLAAQAPDYLITFDCVGFDITLMGGDLFYNSLGCEGAHVLWGEPQEYDEYLKQRINFVMDYYVFSETDAEYIKAHYERVHDCKVMDIDYSILKPQAERPRALEILLVADYTDCAKTVEAMCADGIGFATIGKGYEALAARGKNVPVIAQNVLDAATIYEVACQSKIVIDYTPRKDYRTIAGIVSKGAGAATITMNSDNVKALYQKLAVLLK